MTVGSLAISATFRPPTSARPVTTPSAPRPSASQLASSPSSENDSGSTSRSTRSRTGSLPCWAVFWWWRSGPPARAAASAASNSVSDRVSLTRRTPPSRPPPRRNPCRSPRPSPDRRTRRRAGLGAVLGRGSRDPARQALELGEHRVATVLEVGDHRLDLTPAPVRLVDDPLGLGLGPLARLCRRGIGLLAGLLHVGVGVSADLAPVRVGLLARLVRVLVGLAAQRFGGRVRLYEALTRLPRRLLPDLLRRVVGLGEDVGDLLAGSGELGPDPLGHVADGAVALEPVGELASGTGRPRGGRSREPRGRSVRCGSC